MAGGLLMGIGSKLLQCTNGMGNSGVYRLNSRSLLSIGITLAALYSISNIRKYNMSIGYLNLEDLNTITGND